MLSFQAREAEIAHAMKEENSRAAEAEKAKEWEKYKESVRHQQELERQLEVGNSYRTKKSHHSYDIIKCLCLQKDT